MNLSNSDRRRETVSSLSNWFLSRAIMAAIVLPQLLGSSATADEGGEKLESIIQNIRSNEDLYRNNIEIELSWQSEVNTKLFGPSPVLAEQQNKTRIVHQDGMYYLNSDQHQVTMSNKKKRIDMIAGFDGEKTRMVQQRAVANIHTGRVDDSRLYYPHTLMLYHNAFVAFPLSAFLAGGDELVMHPLAGHYKNEVEVKVRYEGEEVVDGLYCVKLACEEWRRDRSRPNPNCIRYLWLAVDRNYLPIKLEGYYPSMSADEPMEVGRVQELREIAPGIWFPDRVVVQTYHNNMTSDKKTHPLEKTTFQLEKTELNPTYEIDLFRNIPIPEGASVYIVQDGEIVQSYRQGSEPDSR